MNHIKKITVAVAALLTATSVAAIAQTVSQTLPGPWWVHVGPVGVLFNTGAEVKIGGQTVPGGSVQTSNSTTLGVEVGYDVTPNLAARFTMGVPPTTTVTGTGTLAGAGTLGKLTYGPAVLSATWAFDGLGRFRPYVGAGINYTMVLSRKDGALTSFNAKSAFGSVLQTGFDVAINERWGVFIDVKKIFLKTSASGMIGPTPATASVRLNPVLIQAGVTYRF